MKLPPLIYGLLAVTSLSLTGAASGADVINIVTAPQKNAPINLMNGGQFDFFASPIRERMKNNDLLQSWKSVPVKVLRYPGGTWADHYIWNNPAAGYFVSGNADTIVTPAQFIEMCRACNAEPIFEVNTLTYDSNRINPTDINSIRKGAQRAAEWVYDANIKNKWHVKYWEIGNEVWIWLTPKEYAKYVIEYSKAMKKVDPSIKIIACGLDCKVGPFNPHNFLDFSKTDPAWKPRKEVINDGKEWTETLLTDANGAFDYIAPHAYLGGEKGTTDIKELYLQTTAKVYHNDKMKSQYEALANHPESKAQIAITEWACNFGTSVPGSSGKIPPEKGYYYMLGNGINMAYYFGRFLENSNNAIAIVHSLCDSQTLWYWSKKEMAKGAPLDHPSILGLRLWHQYLGTSRMTVNAGPMPTFDCLGENIPAVYLFASEDDQYCYLAAINLDPGQSNTIVWQNAGKDIVSASILNGAALDTNNFGDWEKPVKSVEIKNFTVTPVKNGCQATLPPHSMIGIKVKK